MVNFSSQDFLRKHMPEKVSLIYDAFAESFYLQKNRVFAHSQQQ
jgi:hypothetical protein